MKATQLQRLHDSDRQVKCVYGDDLDVCAQALQKKACKATEVLSQWPSGRTGDLIHTSTTAFMRVLASSLASVFLQLPVVVLGC
jgi:hypothetical protein